MEGCTIEWINEFNCWYSRNATNEICRVSPLSPHFRSLSPGHPFYRLLTSPSSLVAIETLPTLQYIRILYLPKRTEEDCHCARCIEAAQISSATQISHSSRRRRAHLAHRRTLFPIGVVFVLHPVTHVELYVTRRSVSSGHTASVTRQIVHPQSPNGHYRGLSTAHDMAHNCRLAHSLRYTVQNGRVEHKFWSARKFMMTVLFRTTLATMFYLLYHRAVKWASKRFSASGCVIRRIAIELQTAASRTRCVIRNALMKVIVLRL